MLLDYFYFSISFLRNPYLIILKFLIMCDLVDFHFVDFSLIDARLRIFPLLFMMANRLFINVAGRDESNRFIGGVISMVVTIFIV